MAKPSLGHNTLDHLYIWMWMRLHWDQICNFCNFAPRASQRLCWSTAMEGTHGLGRLITSWLGKERGKEDTTVPSSAAYRSEQWTWLPHINTGKMHMHDESTFENKKKGGISNCIDFKCLVAQALCLHWQTPVCSHHLAACGCLSIRSWEGFDSHHRLQRGVK